jgi:hypothetical protein
LRELLTFLEDFVGLELAYSNLVYVVSLAAGRPSRWPISWVDIVEKHRNYFYPFGRPGWPPPPNYLGFRYRGQLQSIHHIESFQVVPDVRKHFAGASGGPNWGPNYLFKLGPGIRPQTVVRAGPRIFRSARAWCMLDTLLTCSTISEALTLTEQRKRLAENAAS